MLVSTYKFTRMDIDTKESSIKNVIGKPNTYNMIRLEKNKPKVLYIAIAEWIYVTGRAAKRIFGPQGKRKLDPLLQFSK